MVWEAIAIFGKMISYIPRHDLNICSEAQWQNCRCIRQPYQYRCNSYRSRYRTIAGNHIYKRNHHCMCFSNMYRMYCTVGISYVSKIFQVSLYYKYFTKKVISEKSISMKECHLTLPGSRPEKEGHQRTAHAAGLVFLLWHVSSELDDYTQDLATMGTPPTWPIQQHQAQTLGNTKNICKLEPYISAAEILDG